MKKNILLILIFVIATTTGCTADYTLKYEDGSFKEILNVSGKKEDDAHPTYDSIKKNGLYADINGTEMFELSPDSSRYDVKLTHKLDDVTLDNLRSVSECFNLNTFKESDTSYYLSLYGGFTCEFLENSTFTLDTDSEVINHNANRVDGNKYIWNLNEKDLDKEGITFQIIKNKIVTSAKKEKDTLIPLWLKIFFAILIICASGALIFIVRKLKTN